MSNNELPRWVNTVLTNEFENDPYWKRGIEQDCPEAYKAIANLQKSPSNVQTYLEAMEIYNKYIGEIVEYYGGQQSVDAYIASYDKLPPGYALPPKLKLRKETKAFLKNGVVPQKIGQFDEPCDGDEMVRLTIEMFKDEIEDNPVKTYRAPKKMRKRLARLDSKTNGSNAYNRAYNNDLDKVVDYDAIYQYAIATEAKKEGHNTEYSDININDLSYSELADYYDEQEKIEQEERDYPVEYVPTRVGRASGSRILVSSSINKYSQWAQVLLDNGFEKGLRKYTKKLDETTRTYIENQTGFSMKSSKQLKKKKKKYKGYLDELNEEQEKADSLRSLAQTLSRQKSGVGSDIDSKIFDDIIRRRK